MIGNTEPRIFTPPLRELTPKTSLGFLAIEYARDTMGITLIPWQEWWMVHALEVVGDLQSDWHFRFRTVLTLVSRQNGKTMLSEVLASFFLNVLCVPHVFGTSHSLEKAEETWTAVVENQQSVPVLSSDIEAVNRRNSGKTLALSGGRKYKVGSPTRRGGRGDSNDLVILDEVREQRDWELWSAAAPSINARPNGIIVGFSNAGDPDSIVLRQIRSQALEALGMGEKKDFGGNTAEALALFEWSAPEGADMDDMEALAQANPSLGHGFLTERALLANMNTFPEAKFRAEYMCQQVETILEPPFPEGSWKAGTDINSKIDEASEIWYGIDLSKDREMASIAVCGFRPDGNAHVEVIARRGGTEWVVEWFTKLSAKGPVKLAFQSRGAPVSGLGEQICTLPNVERMAVEGTELTSGFGRFFDAVSSLTPGKERTGMHVYHLPQPVLDTAAQTAQTRNLGAGALVLDRVKSPDDIAPLQACVCAFTAATSVEIKQEKKIYQSSYADDAELVFV